MYQADKLALGAIGFSFVMTPFFMNEISFFFNLVKKPIHQEPMAIHRLSLQQYRSAFE
jgi:hypothetical protein